MVMNCSFQLLEDDSSSASYTAAAVFAYLEGPLRCPGPVETWRAVMVSLESDSGCSWTVSMVNTC